MARQGEPGVSEAAFVLAGELDLHRADQHEAALLAHARAVPAPVVIDCSQLTFIDSSGLGMLVEVHHESGKQLSLQNMPERCRNVFVLTGLDAMFDLP